MSEDDQRAEIGGLVIRWQNAKSEAACFKTKADRLAGVYRAAAEALDRVSNDDFSLTGDFAPKDWEGVADEAAELIQAASETKTRQDKLRRLLSGHGIEL